MCLATLTLRSCKGKGTEDWPLAIVDLPLSISEMGNAQWPIRNGQCLCTLEASWPLNPEGWRKLAGGKRSAATGYTRDKFRPGGATERMLR